MSLAKETLSGKIQNLYESKQKPLPKSSNPLKGLNNLFISYEKQIKNLEKPLTYHKIHGTILPVECGGIAQLARARGSYPRCRWFKSSSRYFEKGLYKPFFVFWKETNTGKLIIVSLSSS